MDTFKKSVNAFLKMCYNASMSVSDITCFLLFSGRKGDSIMEENLGAKVKKLRIANGLTQEEVAKALDVTPGYISNVENGRNLMTLRMLVYYAELTDVSLDYLAGNVDAKYKKTALDNEIMQLVSRMSNKEKENLIATLRVWLPDSKKKGSK